MIVLAEHELMKTEFKFAIYQGIPVHEANEIKHQKASKANLVNPEDIKGKLKQWRILFYLDTLRDVDFYKLLKIKDPDCSLYIQIKMFEYVTKFELKIPKIHTLSTLGISNIEKINVPVRLNSARSKQTSTIKSKFKTLLSRSSDDSIFDEDEVERGTHSQSKRDYKKLNLKLNKLRVHYFFTEFYEISKFIADTNIELRITEGPDWSKVLASGKVAPFHKMNPNKAR